MHISLLNLALTPSALIWPMRLFESPLDLSPIAVHVNHEEALVTMLEKQRPNNPPVRLGNVETHDVVERMPFESPFSHRTRLNINWSRDFITEEEPMSRIFERPLTDDARQTQIFRRDRDAGFFFNFSDCTSRRTFTYGVLQLPADWRVQVQVRGLDAMQQEHTTLGVEQVSQYSDAVRERHGHSA